MSALKFSKHRRDEMPDQLVGDEDQPDLEEEKVDLGAGSGREVCLEDAFKERMMHMRLRSDINYSLQ